MTFRSPDDALERRLADSLVWSRSEGRSGAPFVADHEDLGGLDLRERVLADAQLYGSNLRGACLDSVDLRDASVDGADFTGASLFKANISRISATESNFDRVNASLTQCGSADFIRASLRGASFRYARATGLSAISCDLADANFTGADLSRASFLGSQTGGLDLALAVIDRLVLSSSALSEGLSTLTALGDPIALPDASEGPVSRALAWEVEVGSALRDLASVEHVFYGVPETDFVVQLRGSTLVAVEAKLSLRSREKRDRDRPSAVAHDLVVVADLGTDGGLPGVTTLADLNSALLVFTQVQREGRGSVLLARRQAARLEPYARLGRTTSSTPPGDDLKLPLPWGDAVAERAAVIEWSRDHLRELEALVRRPLDDPEVNYETKPVLADLALRGVALEEQLIQLVTGGRG